MNSIEYITARDAHAIVDWAKGQHPLANRDASLWIQVEALQARGTALSRLWKSAPLIQRVFPEGFWEEDRDLWCFCESAPNGHELEAVTFRDPSGYRPDVGCLFRDGELWDKLCPACRRPCEAYIVNEVGGEHDERWRSARTKCCGGSPMRPNGCRVSIDECEGEGDE